MINESNKTEIIELYLQGRLDQEFMDEFNHRLSNDQDFKQEVEFQRAIVRNAKRVGRDEMKKTLKLIHSEISSAAADNVIPYQTGARSFSDKRIKSHIRSLRLSKTLLAIAASLILVAVAIFYITLSPSKLFAENFEVYRTASTRAEENASELISHYEQKNYKGTIQAYEALPWSSIKETFLAGNAYLMLSQPDKAINCFERVIKINKNLQPEKRRFEDESEYYMALAYLESNRPTEADVIFRKINEDASHSYHDRASNFLLLKIKLLKLKAD